MDQLVLLPQATRIILHVDMNSFFASVEQQSNPFLRNKPVAVAHSPQYNGSAILAASYPAKRFGIGLNTRLGEARAICPQLIAVPLDTIKYYSVNRQIVKILREESPVVEVYSIDEAFLDVTDICADLAAGEKLAVKIKRRIQSEIGECLTSSIGVSHNKLLAKIGSNFKKPDGITVISWVDRFKFLDQIEIGKIWGIGYHSAPKLRALGINNTSDLRKLDDITLSKLVGSYYTRLRMIANGEHYDPINPNHNHKPHKSMQHAHTLSQATSDPIELKSLIRKLSERLGRRLRRHEQQTKIIFLSIKLANEGHYGWGSYPTYHNGVSLEFATNTGKEIYDAAASIFDSFGLQKQQLVRFVVVGLGDLHMTNEQLFPIFRNEKTEGLNTVTDDINNKFGEFTIRSGDILYQYAKESELSVEREDMTFHPD